MLSKQTQKIVTEELDEAQAEKMLADAWGEVKASRGLISGRVQRDAEEAWRAAKKTVGRFDGGPELVNDWIRTHCNG